ncbi:hypothetical protein [Paracraurococcus lichenis]|uniref:GCN5-related N-acetyltransferase n=1 Tax=Paracraurococcus lichenis TaxID=3064888 RepID=A0ABT9E5R8_9PROT|nr:hypothetical protein [Paracraurococcus sp. LOR1-02]MDO9711514.1 hypothetical protein [Paracraurococcus sp. LOR1-02]
MPPPEDPDPDRAALLARWLDLTRRVLPGMAVAQRWPIRRDHCFMRVCLDAALGGRWDAAVRRPAIRHLTPAQLQAAVAAAARIAAEPGLLPGLNRQSLAWRGRLR